MRSTIDYLWRLAASVLRGGAGWARYRAVARRSAVVAVIAVALSVPVLAFGRTDSVELPRIAALQTRAAHMQTLLDAVERVYHEEVAPIENVLLRYRSEPELARDIAVALFREGRRVGLDPRLLLAVLLVENPDLDPNAVSPVGAVGLMQVMPVHRGEWGGCEPRLDDIDANICHGASIFAHYLDRSDGDVEKALLRYNGCVKGTNTPNCHSYPNWVYARAGRASILAFQPAAAGAMP